MQAQTQETDVKNYQIQRKEYDSILSYLKQRILLTQGTGIASGIAAMRLAKHSNSPIPIPLRFAFPVAAYLCGVTIGGQAAFLLHQSKFQSLNTPLGRDLANNRIEMVDVIPLVKDIYIEENQNHRNKLNKEINEMYTKLGVNKKEETDSVDLSSSFSQDSKEENDDGFDSYSTYEKSVLQNSFSSVDSEELQIDDQHFDTMNNGYDFDKDLTELDGADSTSSSSSSPSSSTSSSELRPRIPLEERLARLEKRNQDRLKELERREKEL